MPNRIIKESINDSRGLSRCSLFAEDLYKRLLTYADDYGRFNADTEIMLARLYPREVFYVSEEDLADALSELAGEGKIAFYTSRVFHAGPQKGGLHIGVYGCFPNWAEHQRVRDNKKRCPDPDDTNINDWYLRRFVPIDMKVELIERAGFKCQECGKYITSCGDAKRFVKLGSGLYHIDHIVPCAQGGRATFENLRVTCPECNVKRKRKFSFNEILEFTVADSSEIADSYSPQVAANRRELPPESESESESNPNMNPTDSCAEPFQASAPTVAALPLLDGTDYGITQEEADKDAQAFPAVDVLQEYLKMERWLTSNPAKKKTRRGIRRFINAWLERAQNQGGTKGAAQQNAIHRGNYSENHDGPRTTYSIQPHFAGE